MKVKILSAVVLFSIIFSISSQIFADSFIDNILNSGSGWFNSAKNSNTNDSFGNSLVSQIGTMGIVEAIFSVGNFIFSVVIVFLGIKYIASGIEGKSKIKETLPNFIVGVIFFYFSKGLLNIFYNGGTGILDVLFFGKTPTFENIQSTIWSTILVIANVLTIGGIIVTGLRYMLASSDTKADVKKSLVPIMIGIIFVYCSFQILTFIVDFAGFVF